MQEAAKQLFREEVYNAWKIGGKPYPEMSRMEEFEYCRERYPEIPKTLMLKEHCITRGVTITDRAWKEFASRKDYKHQFVIIFQRHKRDHTEDLPSPDDFHFNDGTNVMVCLAPPEKDPYTIDYIDGLFCLTDDGTPIEEIGFGQKPKFHGKKTSTDTLMEHVALAPGTDLLLFNPYRHCHFWNEGLQCKYCDMDYCTKLQMKLGRGFKTRLDPIDCYDTTLEAHKEEGKYRHHFITGGSDPRNNYEEEFDFHLALVEAINKAGRDMGIERIAQYVIMSPVDKERMKQLHAAGTECFGAYFEVWPEEKFNLICPGKAKWCGFETFLERTFEAVDVFGWGNVHAGFVSGVEMMYGYNEIEEAVETSLEGYDFLLQHGVIPGGTQLTVQPGTNLYEEGQSEPPLEFYCKLDLGRQELFKKYKANPKYMCYKHQYYTIYPDLARML